MYSKFFLTGNKISGRYKNPETYSILYIKSDKKRVTIEVALELIDWEKKWWGHKC